MNSRKCYQLKAKGDSVNGWRFNMKSKAVFIDEEDAKRFIPKFEEKCYDNTHFDCAVKGSLTVEIMELELYG